MSDRKNLLVVCDDEMICQVTQKRLEILGYNSIVATGAEAARLAFQHNSEKFNLVMMDRNLFDGDGIDLASEFLDIRPGIPIALYTGGSTVIEDVQPMGICAVISKALTLEEFADALRQVFDGADIAPTSVSRSEEIAPHGMPLQTRLRPHLYFSPAADYLR